MMRFKRRNGSRNKAEKQKGGNAMKKITAGAISGIVCMTWILGMENRDRINPVWNIHADAVYASTYAVDYPTGVHVRDGADTSCTILGKADYGVLFTVSQENDGWGYTRYAACTDGTLKSGWIYLGNCRPADIEMQTNSSSRTQTETASDMQTADYKIVVTSNIGVNMRTGASTDCKKICVIDTNEILTVSSVKNGWGCVRYKNMEGWVSLAYTQPHSGSASNNAVSSDARRNSCDFGAAFQYAKTYWCQRNLSYPYYTNNNCANFCSQILEASGMKTDSRWCSGSTAFINTIYLRDYFVDTYGTVYLSNPSASEIAEGDIIYTDNLGHVMFVMDVTSDGRILCSGNTNNRDSMPVSINAICAVLKTSDFF